MIDEHILVPGGADDADAGIPLFSADSHVIEDPLLWHGILPDGHFKAEDASNMQRRPGRVDPVERLKEMRLDGVIGEVLYPSLALSLFGMTDAELQRRCFRRYNDWLIDFCATDPRRLIGVAMLSAYDTDEAVAELERCASRGLRGALIWQTPHPDLPFTSAHYEPIWAACASLGLPVSLHILSGTQWHVGPAQHYGLSSLPDDELRTVIDRHRVTVNIKLLAVMDALLDILHSGTFDRHPELKLVLVENEIGWLPFFLDQVDFYRERWKNERPTPMQRRANDYVGTQLFSTFFRDPIGMHLLDWWGEGAGMWSNDYPHGNSTLPNSQKTVREHLGHLAPERFRKVVRETAMALYGVPGDGKRRRIVTVTRGNEGKGEAVETEAVVRPTYKKFTARGLPILSGGHQTETVAMAENLKVTTKVYCNGGENGLHCHPTEDHAFFIIHGEASFLDENEVETRVRSFEGLMIPKGCLYRFQSVGEENLIMIRMGGAAHAEDMGLRMGRDGRPALGHDLANKTGAESAVPIPDRFFDPA